MKVGFRKVCHFLQTMSSELPSIECLTREILPSGTNNIRGSYPESSRGLGCRCTIEICSLLSKKREKLPLLYCPWTLTFFNAGVMQRGADHGAPSFHRLAGIASHHARDCTIRQARTQAGTPGATLVNAALGYGYGYLSICELLTSNPPLSSGPSGPLNNKKFPNAKDGRDADLSLADPSFKKRCDSSEKKNGLIAATLIGTSSCDMTGFYYHLLDAS
jgi:hypothetical protein